MLKKLKINDEDIKDDPYLEKCELLQTHLKRVWRDLKSLNKAMKPIKIYSE